MDHLIGDLPMHYVEHGEGVPVLGLHGAGVDHREIMACLDPVLDAITGYRRIYPDLPGMGLTPAPEAITGAEDVLDVLLRFIQSVVGDERLLVVGHSAGAYFAEAIARQRPGQVVGLALLCPLLSGIHDVPQPEVVFGPGSIGDAEFRSYFTVQTPHTLERYQKYVEPGAILADFGALARIGERWELNTGPQGPYRHPTLVLTGRQDATVGYAHAWALLEQFPRATFAVLDRAGHALPHEQPDLLRALVTEWLDRVQEAVTTR